IGARLQWILNSFQADVEGCDALQGNAWKAKFLLAKPSIGLPTLTAHCQLAKRYSSIRQINIKKLKSSFNCHVFWSIKEDR
ncbi:hypothetical protein, partial [Salmonella sp. ZJHZ21_0168]|uniref:hypothetical protein n=1 Tax=Salmonella sp. ZJHZ21_0168 TaxID=3159600 RepID=UPI00397EB16F